MTGASSLSLNLAALLEGFMLESGLTQSEIARRAGISQSVISRILSRKVETVHTPTLTKLAAVI